MKKSAGFAVVAQTVPHVSSQKLPASRVRNTLYTESSLKLLSIDSTVMQPSLQTLYMQSCTKSLRRGG